jgi:RNA polymerase sigma factor for flagellar operon FliA
MHNQHDAGSSNKTHPSAASDDSMQRVGAAGVSAHPRVSTDNRGVERLTAEQQSMVEKNIALVHHIVSRMTENFPAAVQRDDMVQAGLVGLIEATQRFDADRGFSFSTFAGRRIEGAVLDLLRRADWAPRSVRRNERQLHEMEAGLTAQLGRRPTADELGSAMGTGVDHVHNLRADVAKARLNPLVVRSRTDGDDAGLSDLDLPATNVPDTLDLEHQELMGYLRDGIDLLPERHRIVIVGHFLEGRSMTELGELLGVTQSRASQLKSEALGMLKAGIDVNLDGVEPKKNPTARQADFNEALGSASSWRDRVGIRTDLATA